MKLYQKLTLSILSILILLSIAGISFMLIRQNNESKILQSKLETSQIPDRVIREESPKKNQNTAVVTNQETETPATKPINKDITNTPAPVPTPAPKPFSKTGSFRHFGDYPTSGAVSVTENNGNFVLNLGEDFNFVGSPDSVLYLCPEAEPKSVQNCVIISTLEKDTGSQAYKLNKSEVERYSNLILWCRSFSLLMASAQLN